MGMKIEIPGVLQKFSAMTVGGFFRIALSKRKDFGICVSMDGKQLAAIIFPEEGQPRLQVGGLSMEVVYYPEAILRADGFEFLRGDEFGSGAVMKAADGNSYIRITEGGLGNYRTFNLETGLLAPLPDDVPRVLYAHWKVGVLIDGEFAEMFCLGRGPGA
jgi:hypothetical protein